MSTWPQCAMLYDGTFAGFLSCVGESFRQKVYPFYFLPPWAEQVSLYPLLEVPTDQALAREIYGQLEERVSPTFRRMITYSFLTSLPQRERNMFDVIYLAFHRALPQDLTDERILVLTRAIRRLVNEAHQYKGFVRFADYGGVLVGASGSCAPWTGWTWTTPTRPRSSARLSGGSFTTPSPSPSGTTPAAVRPTCPSDTGAK